MVLGKGPIALSHILKRLVARAPAEPSASERPLRRLIDINIDPTCAYAVGDIHGCIDKLRHLERTIVADAASIRGSKLLVYLGDYIDRGPGSAAVIEHLLAPPPPGFNRVCLCGNHEEILIDVVDGRRPVRDWLRTGGERTLHSYGYDVSYMTKHRGADAEEVKKEMLAAIPTRHIDFLRQLPCALATPSYIFVHAGLRPGVPLGEQTDHDLLWIREPFLSDDTPAAGRLVVHGHTPIDAPKMTGGRIGIDTGACMGGPLTAARLVGRTVAFIDDRFTI